MSEQTVLDTVDTGGIPAHQAPIFALEDYLLQFPQTELPVVHDFCAGVYARSLFIPAGTVLTGAIHREESFFLVRSGVLAVTIGDKVVEVSEGFMAVTKPGEKRAGLAITDVLVTTFHANPNNLTDPNEIWDRFTVPDPRTLLQDGES